MTNDLDKYIVNYQKNRNMQNKLEQRWLRMFLELLNFKNVHGHTNVPAKYIKFKALGYWVRKQRYIYNQDKLDPLRKELLQSIGFNFRLMSIHDWDTMYDKLLQFKNEHRHVCITDRNKDVQLYNWLGYQRKLYWRGKLEGQKLDKLKTLGVDMQNKTLNRWEIKYGRLVKFRKKHGHLFVCRSFTNDKELISFVKVIRRDKNNISAERKEKLDKIGFIWNPGKETNILLNKQRGDEKWMQRFGELKAFKKEYRHCRVPFNHIKYKTLYGWLSKQKNNLDQLPDDKIRMLKEVGI
jgi:hypothetical protein